MLRIVLVTAVIAIGVTAVGAQSNPVGERNALMSSMWRDAWGPITRMVQGKDPYDQAKVDAGFTRVLDIANKARPLWPDNAKGAAPNATYTSSAKIWENKGDFEAKLADLVKEVNANRPKATNLEGLKVAFKPVDQSCDNCHEPYRVRVR